MIEIIACSVADAIAAERGGADRLEIVSHLEHGGLTPPLALVRDMQTAVRLPLRVMVREDEDFFVADAKKIERLCEVARSCADLSVDGLVLGFLTRRGSEVEIAHAVLEQVLDAASTTRITFHRAFEVVTNPRAAIAELKKYEQIDCILTSHGARPADDTGAWPPPWPERFNGLAELADLAAPEIGILIGGGVTAGMIESLCREPQNRQKLSQIHLGQAVRAGHSLSGAVQTELVQALAQRWNRTNQTQ
jgi:copper homeostasis protein